MKSMRENIELLKRDRKVNETFMSKLENIGLEINHGTYSYWDFQEYIQIGLERVWLVETEYFDQGNSSRCVWRYQNDVVEEIIQTINEQVEDFGKEDQMVGEFFAKLSA